MFGDSDYQRHARSALPILVRQALMHKSIFYKELAAELGGAFPRNMNYVLGSVGTTLSDLGKKWNEHIPPIQSLAINVGSGQPGAGFFGGEELFKKLTKRQREAHLNSEWAEIFAYPKWKQVLDSLELRPIDPVARELIESARSIQGRGESAEHKRLKEAIAKQPSLAKLPSNLKCLQTEYPLPSGDCIDVCFERGANVYAVEVKSIISPPGDVARGLYQCVKYKSVLEAWRAYLGYEGDVMVVLALGGKLPEDLVSLKDALQVKVVESVKYS